MADMLMETMLTVQKTVLWREKRKRTRTLTRRCFLLSLSISSLQVNREEEEDISVRSSYVYGRSCFSSAGYSGSCRSQTYCKGTSYSYSR